MVKCKPPTTQLGLIKDISVETLVTVVGRIRHTPTQTLSLVIQVELGLNLELNHHLFLQVSVGKPTQKYNNSDWAEGLKEISVL